jgi:DNA-binding IclR family transcriptional regulator
MPDGTSPRRLKTVDTTVEIMRSLEELDGAGVTELADHLDISKAAVYNHLATLRENRLVVQEGTTYKLSLRFLALGEYVKHQSDLYNAGKEETDKLADETGEFAHLMAEEYGRGIHIYKGEGENAVGKDYLTLNLEKPDYMHYTSTGKAVLAYLPESRVSEIVEEHGLPARTENTITTEERLFEELAEIRDRGYATNDEEEIKGLRAVGAPVRDNEDDVLGAISVSAPVSRMKDEAFRQAIPEKVKRAANVIELNIETSNIE